MALKHAIAQLTDVAEAVRSFYEAGQDGKFYLQVEGLVPKAQLDEFRNNNIALQQKVQKFETDYKDVDVAKYRTLLAAEGKTPEQIEAAVQARVAQLNQEHEGVVTQLTTQNKALSSQLDLVLVEGGLRSAAAANGVLATAVDDVVLRGRMVFQRNEKGEIIAKNAKGEPMYDKDGTSPLKMETWLKDLKKAAPHLFEGMKGSGGGGNGGQGGGGLPANATATQKIAAGLANMNG